MHPTSTTGSGARPLVVVAVAAALVASCAGQPAGGPSPGPTEAPTAAAAPVSTPTPAVAATAAPVPAPTQQVTATTAPSAASPAAVHVSYLDLTTNIGELRSRVADWQKGNAQSLDGAAERVERVQTVLKHVAWPQALAGPIGELTTAIGSVDAALKAKDVAASTVPMEKVGELSHDVTHDFYDKWLAETTSRHTRDMDVHVVYMDVTGNVADLRARVGDWEKGSGQGLTIAKETAERLHGLLGEHITWPSSLAGPVATIRTKLPGLEAALDAKDVARAKVAAGEIGEASHDLTHELYEEWMPKAMGSDVSCMHTGFLDLTGNVADLRLRVGEWEKGSEQGLSTAKEKLERISAILEHEKWTSEIAEDIDHIRAQVGPMAAALNARDMKAGARIASEMNEASHDLTHEFYETYASAAMR